MPVAMASALPREPAVFPHPELEEHALVDSGNGRKLERFGAYVLDRPDPQALWRPRLPAEEWERADLVFVRESDRGGRWESGPRAPAGREAPLERGWPVRERGGVFLVRPTPFKHVGLFPEQAANWDWVAGLGAELARGEARPRLLSLFAYTGVASVLAVRAGFEVTHVDAARAALAAARENLAASGLAPDAARLVLDDALGFARREARRGARYEGILLDPPHHGRGPKGERWEFEEGLAPLVEACAALLAPRAFLALSSYAIGYSPLAFLNLLSELEGGETEAGELALPEERRPGLAARRLPSGFCARWWRGLAGEGGARP
jgi:23S rRNA (cytosine1962-C5)-methyltransferase